MGEGLAEQCGMPPFKPGKSRKSRADSPDKSRESTTARAFATAMLLAMARSAAYVHAAGGELWEEYDGSGTGRCTLPTQGSPQGGQRAQEYDQGEDRPVVYDDMG